jgi:hypothetical protein
MICTLLLHTLYLNEIHSYENTLSWIQVSCTCDTHQYNTVEEASTVLGIMLTIHLCTETSKICNSCSLFFFFDEIIRDV